MSLHQWPICNSYQIQQTHPLLLLCLVFPVCVSWLLHSKGKDKDFNRARHRHSWTHFYIHFSSTIKRNKCTLKRNKLFSSQPFLFLKLLQADLIQGQDCLYGVTLLSVKFNLPLLWTAGLCLWWLQKIRLKNENKPSNKKPPNKTHKQQSEKNPEDSSNAENSSVFSRKRKLSFLKESWAIASRYG